MQCLIDSLVYLVATLGIIFTTMSFYDMFFYGKRTYRIYSKTSNEDKSVEIIIKLKKVNEKEEEEIVKMIQESECVNLKKMANYIIIQNDD